MLVHLEAASGDVKICTLGDEPLCCRESAVGLVIASHAELPFLRGGFVGVDIFFVLFGYLMTSLLMQEISSSGTVNFPRFYARRARRLLPAATTMVLVVCSAEAIIMNPVAQFRTLKTALATVLYSSNLYFANLQVQYFHQHSVTNPLLHTWSLAVEEQFYLIWPVLLLLLARTIKSVRDRSIALTGISLASFVLRIWLTATNSGLAFFETPARVWEFGAGGLLVFMPERWLGGHRRLWSWLGGIRVIALMAGADLIHASKFPGYVAMIPVVGTVLLLLAGVGAPESPATSAVANKTGPGNRTAFLSALLMALACTGDRATTDSQKLVPNSIGVDCCRRHYGRYNLLRDRKSDPAPAISRCALGPATRDRGTSRDLVRRRNRCLASNFVPLGTVPQV
jgi:peptidoglycan/LPS O-acetylase OafA/YrhL